MPRYKIKAHTEDLKYFIILQTAFCSLKEPADTQDQVLRNEWKQVERKSFYIEFCASVNALAS